VSLDGQQVAPVAVQNSKFSKQFKLLKPAEFDKVFAGSSKVGGPGFTLFFIKNELSSARLGLSVPKRAFTRAVDRNHIKRLVRESFRQNREALPHFDVIFLARKGVLDKSSNVLSGSLQRAWQRLQDYA